MLRKKLIIVLLITFTFTLSIFATSVRADTEGVWITKAPLPNFRADLPSVGYHGMVYVFGGYYDSWSGGQSEVYSYNPSTDSWTQKSSMTYPRWGCAAAVFGDNAYVFGGEYMGAGSNKVEAYNFEMNSWVTKHDLPEGVSAQGLGAVTVGSLIYLFYGPNTFAYNPLTDQYSQLRSAPYSKDWAEYAYVNVAGEDRIYILGGFDFSLGAVATCAYFRPTNNDWITVGVAPYAAYGTLRDDPVVNGLIYYGYGQGPNSFYAYLYSFNPSTAVWSQLPSGAYPRDGVCCGIIYDKLYVIGGRSSWSSPVMGLSYTEQFNLKKGLEVSINPSKVTMFTSNHSQTFTSYVTGDSSGISYQWVLNDGIVTGATQPSWTFAPTQAGSYTIYVYVTDAVGGKTLSNNAQVYFYNQYPLSVTTNYGSTSPSTGGFDAGSVVSLKANPPNLDANERYIWEGWAGTGSGSYSGVDNPATITINGAINESALWKHEYKLTLTTNFGATYPSSAEYWYQEGSTLTISASSPNAGLNERYSWFGWTGSGFGSYSGNTNEVVITMNGPITEFASWCHEYKLTLSSDAGTLTPSVGEHWYKTGTSINIAANPPSSSGDTRAAWAGWSGSGTNSYTGNNNPCTIIMEGPVTEVALWKTEYKLTIATNLGTTQPPAGENWYLPGTTITVQASLPTAQAGTHFICMGWIGTGSIPAFGSNLETTFTLNAPSSISWVWKTQYYLTVNSAYGNAGGTGWYDAGTTAFITITPTIVTGDSGVRFSFNRWSDEISGSGSPSRDIVMDKPITVVANWITEYYMTVSTSQGNVNGGGWYLAGSEATVRLDSSISPGPIGTQYIFSGWNKDAKGIGLSSNIVMNGPKTATTMWQTQYSLSFKQSGVGYDLKGQFIIVNGTGYDLTGFSTWANASDTYVFSYLPIVSNAKGQQYILIGVNGNNNDSSVNTSEAKTITGFYRTQYYMSVISSHGTTTGSGWYDSGAVVKIAVPAIVSEETGTQHVFDGWSTNNSDTISTDNTFIMDGPKTAKANWRTQYALTFVVSPPGAATLSSSSVVWEDSGQTSISVIPNKGYTFSAWSTNTGNLMIEKVNSASTKVTINGPGTITASLIAESVATPPTATPTTTPSSTPITNPTCSPTPTSTPNPTVNLSLPPNATITAASTPLGFAFIESSKMDEYLYGAFPIFVGVTLISAVLYLKKRGLGISH